MNLVAKETLLRTDQTGVLILSEMAGASRSWASNHCESNDIEDIRALQQALRCQRTSRSAKQDYADKVKTDDAWSGGRMIFALPGSERKKIKKYLDTHARNAWSVIRAGSSPTHSVDYDAHCAVCEQSLLAKPSKEVLNVQAACRYRGMMSLLLRSHRGY
jgi:hypothetical protein